MSPGRHLFASIHCDLDPSSGAVLATRDLLEILAARGWNCRSLTCGILDDHGETSVNERLRVSEIEGSARRMMASLGPGGDGGGRVRAGGRPGHGDADVLQPRRACTRVTAFSTGSAGWFCCRHCDVT